MAEIPSRWRRRHRRMPRSQRSPSESFDESQSQSNDNFVIDKGRRDPALDDALFGFFRKQAVNSMKRNFSDFCKHTIGANEVKKIRTDGLDKSAFTRFGCKYFLAVLKKLTPQQRSIIQKFGFGCLLLFDSCHIPSDFTRWVSHCVDPLCSQISVCGQSVDISKETFHIVLGLPIDGLQVSPNCDAGKAFILSLFKLSDLPLVTFFGNKLSGPDPLSEIDVFVCFMTVAISCFLCPDSSESVNWKYLSILKDPAAAKSYDFNHLVYSHCLSSLYEFSSFGKLNGRRTRSPVCCNYVPVVRYLDCLDFGKMNVADRVPRISVWKGDMVKVFSDLDRKCGHQFGKKHLKPVPLSGHHHKGLPYSHANEIPRASPVLSPLSGDFRAKARDQYVSSLQDDVVDGILKIGDNFLSSKSSTGKRKLELLLNNVLEFLSKSRYTHNNVIANQKGPDQSIVNQPHTTALNANMQHVQFVAEPEIPKDNPTPTLHGSAKHDASSSKRTPDPVTPECVITNVQDGHTHSTAPVMAPLRKIKARKISSMSVEDEQNMLIHRPRRATSSVTAPIVDVPDSPTESFKLNRVHAIQNSGSKQAPIKISDIPSNPSVGVNADAVQLVGTTDFQRRRSEVSRNVDNTYNNLVLSNQLNQQAANGVSTAHEQVQRANGEGISKDVQPVPKVRVRVKYKFVDWLLTGQNPPLQSNTRFVVSEEDIIHYSAIVELAHGPKATTFGVLYPKIHCSYKSLGQSLMPNGEVDNFLIPCLCRVLFEERHPTLSGRHYFFPNIGEAILNYTGQNQESTDRASFEGARSASKGRKLGHKDNRLFFPIVNSGHWFAFAVDFGEKVFAFLDSYYDEDSPFLASIKGRLIENFVHLWELIFSPSHNFGEFETIYPDVPKQQTLTKDCGVFVMKLMETWMPSVDTRNIFSHEDILNIRILYANKLHFYPKNEADLSLVTDFYAQG